MGPVSLYVKDPTTSRFVAGGVAEAEDLLGVVLPTLPRPQSDGTRELFHVRFHPRLHTLLVRFLQGLLGEIAQETPMLGGREKEEGAKNTAEYESVLCSLLKSIRCADRRTGLANLFWLAHTKDIAESLKEMESTRGPSVRKLKYFLHPLLASFYRRAEDLARREVERVEPGKGRLLAGAKESSALVDSLIEDGFAFSETTIAEFDFNQFLASNKRYRLSADLFFEIYSILIKETERRLKEGDRGLLSRVSRHLPGLPKDLYLTQGGVTKIMMNGHVMTYLFADAWGTGARLTASAKLKAEAERRKPTEILDVFLEIVAGVKRFEILSSIRDRVVLLKPFDEERSDRTSPSARTYEFSETAHVLNNAVNVTVLFLDLRGFTKTSEGQMVSEGDLTRELYVVFDAFVPHVRRFGGTIDKFLGDGIMITYGTEQTTPFDPLNAVRTAILCQEAIRHLREQEKTYFQMGISIHYGRAYLARFIADEESVQSTVIGRNVNLAGRLSSGAKKAVDEEDEGMGALDPAPWRTSGLSVTVDAGGSLINEGIVISRDTLLQLEAHVPLTRTEPTDGSRLEYFDETIGKKILIRYAGDAKFKGVRSSFPVHEVDYEG